MISIEETWRTKYAPAAEQIADVYVHVPYVVDFHVDVHAVAVALYARSLRVVAQREVPATGTHHAQAERVTLKEKFFFLMIRQWNSYIYFLMS